MSTKIRVCLKTFEMSPRKPNSAKRKVCKVRLTYSIGHVNHKSNKKPDRRVITAHIPGEGHSLSEHGILLVSGGRAKDLPGVKYRVIRGVFDCAPVKGRSRALSYYGKSK